MCFGLSKDKKLNRDKKIKPEKILRRGFCWRKQYAAAGTLTAFFGFAAVENLWQQKRQT
jgi:hypothetical protein